MKLKRIDWRADSRREWEASERGQKKKERQ